MPIPRRSRALLGLLPLVALVAAVDVRPLPFYYDLYTFRGANGRTDVVAAFAVPAGRLEPERLPGRARYRFDVTLVLADTALQTVTRTDDSVYVETRSRLDGDHLLFTHIQVAARPSQTTFHRVIMTDATSPGIGQLYGDAFRIRDYSGGELMLSDIALGHPETREGWQRGAVTLALLPTSQFPGSEFDVFYEIYNLPGGHAYRTEVIVQRVDGRGADEGEPVSIRFRGESPAGDDGVVQELRRVDTALPRGKHRITVAVTDLITGANARRSRLFTVRGDARGATMVPALPRASVVGTR
jgi:hypothetical protein